LAGTNTNPHHQGELNGKWIFIKDVFIAICVISAVMACALWQPLLCVPINKYPVTADVIAHLGKVTYIADCLKNLNWPSWFPYWYNGTTVGQYYPPLSFFILAPVQMLFDNVMITFKFYVFFYLLVGAMGVWYICYRWISTWWGIVAGIIYGLYPFLIRSLAEEGVMAQGPIFAFTPWLLAVTLLFVEKRSPYRAALVSIFTGILILSHAMHAFIICLAIGILLLVMVIFCHIDFRYFIIWGIAVGLGAGMVSFWWVPGVTPFEDPLVPYVLPENALSYTANLDWFYFGSKVPHYFSPLLLVLSLGSLFFLKDAQDEHVLCDMTSNCHHLDTSGLIISLVISLVVVITLSFGYHLPIYEYIPFHNNIFFGRILSFAIVLVSILLVIFLRGLWYKFNSPHFGIFRILLFAGIFLIIMYDINPNNNNIRFQSFADTQSIVDQIPLDGNFSNGRIEWLMLHGPDAVYFPMIKDINSVNGSAIEGTPHSRAFWLQNIAIGANCGDYVVKNMLQWNVRATIVSNKYTSVLQSLQKYGFQEISKDQVLTVFVSNTPSSYFMRVERNAIAIGKGAPGLGISFPWLIQGLSNALEDYTLEDLDRFQFIYLSQPEVKDSSKFQELVEALSSAGKTVIVEMGGANAWSLFGIIPYKENIPENAQLVPVGDSPFKHSIPLQSDPNGELPAMGNLDGVWMEILAGGKRIPVIGYKNVHGNKVYFVGMNLGLHLEPEVKRSRGLLETYSDSKAVQSLFEQIMDLGHPYKDIVPKDFPVSDAEWRHDGFSFHYKSQEPVSIIISVTYTPRWQAKVDGNPLAVKRMENLILLDLPAGDHTVVFHYGMTWVGWLGIVLSIFSLLIVIFIYRRFEDLDRFFAFINKQIKRMVEGVGA